MTSSFDHDTTCSQVIEHFKPQVDGKTFVVTGPSAGGLGACTARALAGGSPKRIILAGRSLPKIRPVIHEINKIDPSVIVNFVNVDLADNASVRQGGAKIQELTSEIHGLINSAGIMGTKQFLTSKDGIELQFASNHVGHFLLTNLLMPEIMKVKGVVSNLTSGGYQLADLELEDPNFNNGTEYNPWSGYARAKAANILFSVALAKRLETSDCAAFSVDPGYVGSTLLQKNSDLTADDMAAGFKLASERGVVAEAMAPRTDEQGAATIVLSLLDPKLRVIESSGAYLAKCRVGQPKEYVIDPVSAESLWSLSERLVGEHFTNF